MTALSFQVALSGDNPLSVRQVGENGIPVFGGPERVAPGTWLYDQRPQWLLSTAPPPLAEPLRDLVDALVVMMASWISTSPLGLGSRFLSPVVRLLDLLGDLLFDA